MIHNQLRTNNMKPVFAQKSEKLTERIQALKSLELLNAASQRPESDNILYEIGIKQMAIYGTNYVGSKNRRNEWYNNKIIREKHRWN